MDQHTKDFFKEHIHFKHFTLWQKFKLLFRPTKISCDYDLRTGDPLYYIKFKTLRTNGDSHSVCIIDMGDIPSDN